MIEKHSFNPRTKDSLCPSSEDFVSSWTLTKCGPKNAPLIGGLCHAADFDQMWSKTIEKHLSNPRTKDLLCPSSENFVSPQTLTKCGPKNAPLIEGLCHAVDFNQMWSEMCPSLEDFVSSRTLTKCGPIMRPSLEDFVMLQTFDQIWSIMRPSLEDFVASRTFLTNSSRSTNIQVKTNLFDRPELLKGSSFAEKHHMTQASTKDDTTCVHANLSTNDADCARQSQPNSTASYNNLNGKHSYMIYLDYLKIFGYVRWSFGQ
jgi:hypothetical protein